MMSTIDLMHGKFENLASVIKENYKVKLTFIDPPDNCGTHYQNYTDNLPNSLYVELLKLWITKCCDLTDGPVFLSIADKWVSETEYIIKKGFIPLIKRIYWHFKFGQANNYIYSPCIRNMYWLNNSTIYPDNIKIQSDRMKKYNDKRAKAGGKMPSNLWEFPRICGTFKERRKFHPCQHPEALLQRIILGHSEPGETVLDPMIGSGTTAIVCNRLNRNCIGIDCSKYYLDKIGEIINED